MYNVCEASFNSEEEKELCGREKKIKNLEKTTASKLLTKLLRIQKALMLQPPPVMASRDSCLRRNEDASNFTKKELFWRLTVCR